MRKSMGPIFSVAHDRPVTNRELLTAMGFVAYQSVADATGMPVMIPEEMMELPFMQAATGNAMHLASATVILVIAMAGTRIKQAVQLCII